MATIEDLITCETDEEGYVTASLILEFTDASDVKAIGNMLVYIADLVAKARREGWNV